MTTTAQQVKAICNATGTLAIALQKGYVVQRGVGRVPIPVPARVWNVTTKADRIMALTVQYPDNSVLRYEADDT